MFVRFVLGGEDQDHRQLTGIITEARILRDEGVLADYEEAHLKETYAWFNKNLPCPPFSRSRWARGAVCWFKDSAADSIQRMRDIAALLEEHGELVRMLRSRRPGKILYEDQHQVVVIEWKALYH